MKKKLTFIVLAIITLIITYFLKDINPQSSLNWLSIGHILIVPFCYFLSSAFLVSQHSQYKQLLLITLTILLYIIVSDGFSFDISLSKITASLVGALITFLGLLIYNKISDQSN